MDNLLEEDENELEGGRGASRNVSQQQDKNKLTVQQSPPSSTITAGLAIKSDDIWSRSLQLLSTIEPVEHSLLHGYSTLIFIGSPCCGKTTIIDRFTSMVAATNVSSSVATTTTNDYDNESAISIASTNDSTNTNGSSSSGSSSGGGGTSTKSQNIKHHETIALDYRCVRKDTFGSGSGGGGRHNANNIVDNMLDYRTCNIYELGQILLFKELLPLTLSIETLSHTSLVLVVDLTKPYELAAIVEQCIGVMLDCIERLLQSSSSSSSTTTLATELYTQAKARAFAHQKDPTSTTTTTSSSSSFRPFPIPLVILGGRYDEFQNFDPEIRKQVVRYLRTIAVMYGAAVIFVSIKSETLIRRVYTMLNMLAFTCPNFAVSSQSGGGGEKPVVSTNFNKPILLPFGYDTLTRIGLTTNTNANTTSLIREVLDSFRAQFPQTNIDTAYESTVIDGRKKPQQQDDERKMRTTSINNITTTTDTTDAVHKLDNLANFAESEIDKILEYRYMMLNVD